MRQTVAVSKRGHILLPANLRKRLGIRSGGAVTVEVRERELIVRPATDADIDLYADDEIAQWNREDVLDEGERRALSERLAARHS